MNEVLGHKPENQMDRKLVVRESKIAGSGSFATKNIKDKQTIKALTGGVFTGAELDRRLMEGLSWLDDDIQIGEDLFLDPDKNSRYFNHSCNPNAGMKGRDQVEIFAIRDIAEGEEITIDYSTGTGMNKDSSWIYQNVDWTMDCNCGSGNCRRVIGNVSTIPIETLRWYYEIDALPDFIKGQVREYLNFLI